MPRRSARAQGRTQAQTQTQNQTRARSTKTKSQNQPSASGSSGSVPVGVHVKQGAQETRDVDEEQEEEEEEAKHESDDEHEEQEDEEEEYDEPVRKKRKPVRKNTKAKTKTQGTKRQRVESTTTATAVVPSATQTQPPTKKPRALLKKPKKVETILDLDIDVLIEIFALLPPPSLLALTHTCKATRALLLSPLSTTAIWDVSLLRARVSVSVSVGWPGTPVPLPECPEGMEVWKWAGLAFGRECFNCHRVNKYMNTIWAARTRLCSKCLEEKYTRSSPTALLPLALEDLRPLLPKVSRQAMYRGPEYYAVDIAERWEAEYEQTAEADRAGWLQAKVEEYTAIDEHAQACIAWHEQYLVQLEKEKKSTYLGRVDALLDRLAEMGWDADVQDIRERTRLEWHERPFAELPVVLKVCQKDFTERILQNNLPALTAHMQAYRPQRLARSRAKTLRARIPHLKVAVSAYQSAHTPPSAVPVTLGDFFLAPEVLEFLLNAPKLEGPGDLEEVSARFPEIEERVRGELWARLVKLVESGDEGDEEGRYPSAPIPARTKHTFDPDTVLGLATTQFRCTSCSSYLLPQRALAHECAVRCPAGEHGTCKICKADPSGDLAVLASASASSAIQGQGHGAVQGTNKAAPWNSHGAIKFAAAGRAVLARVLGICGVDPATATREEMDVLDPLVECLSCNSEKHGRCVMRWNLVAAHASKKHKMMHWGKPENGEMELEILQGEDADTIRKRMDEEEELRRAHTACYDLTCAHCWVSGNSVSMRKHVKKVHGIVNPTDNDIVVKIDAEDVRRIFYAWPSRPVVMQV